MTGILDRFGRPLASSSTSGRRSGRGGWIGGHTDRPGTTEWLPPIGSADEDNQPAREDIIARSRHLGMNEPTVAGHLRTLVTYLVGERGMNPRPEFDPRDLGLTRGEARALRRRILKLWKYHFQSPACDFDGVSSIVELQAIALISKIQSGDCLVIRRRDMSSDREGLPRLQLQLIEGDRLMNPRGMQDGSRLTNGNTITGGVEKNARGQPVAYHVSETHPGSRLGRTGSVQRIPARGSGGRPRVLHVFERKRPGQTRGMPDIAAILEPLKVFGRLREAKLLQEAVKACFTAFVTTTGASGGLPRGGHLDARGALDNASGEYRLGPAAVVTMSAGQDVKFAQPGNHDSGFDVFQEAFLKHMAPALGTNYQTLAKTYLSSYSAARASLMDMQRFLKSVGGFLASKMLVPVYGWFLEDLVLEGLIELPGYWDDPLYREAACEATFRGETLGAIDELKTANAAKARIDAGISNEIREAHRAGEDWEDLQEEEAYMAEVRDELGLPARTPETPPAPPPGPAAEDDPDALDQDLDEELDGQDRRDLRALAGGAA